VEKKNLGKAPQTFGIMPVLPCLGGASGDK